MPAELVAGIHLWWDTESKSRSKSAVGKGPYNKENNNLENWTHNIIQHFRNRARNMVVALEVRCFIYFLDYFSNYKHEAYEAICLWCCISLDPFDIGIAQKYLLKIATLTLYRSLQQPDIFHILRQCISLIYLNFYLRYGYPFLCKQPSYQYIISEVF